MLNKKADVQLTTQTIVVLVLLVLVMAAILFVWMKMLK